MTSSNGLSAAAFFVSGLAVAGPPAANTVPTGGTVQHGTATIQAPVNNATGGQTLRIDQASQRAIINWNTFDIGGASEVRFNQPNAGASALNRIFDANPTVIQGKLTANGQVYLINRNGILFDRGSQVNVHTLLATTLDIDDEVYKRLGLAAGAGTPALSAAPGTLPGGIELKGLIQTLAGGAVYVFAPTVRHEGVIRSPDGQVILAAGNVAYLYENPVPTDTSMRGLLVEVKASDGDVNLTSLVANLGKISTDRGNVTLAGLAVNQHGTISASSAALQNGSIWLLSRTRSESGGVGRTGKVSLSSDSSTTTPLDTTDTTSLAEDQDYTPYRSIIRVEGKTIDHGGIIRSPGGVVSMTAFDAENSAATDSSRIYLAGGSVIDASGNWADLPLSKVLLSVQLTSNELKDAPVQKGGFLQGQTVALDLRRGTPLFDYSGYLGSIKRSVGEKAATAGEIRLSSSNGDLIQRQGATLDVSGGGYRYGGGSVETTRLTSNGRSYDISEATPDLLYDGTQNVFVQRYTKWGVTESFARASASRAVSEGPSVEGKAAGSISVVAAGGAVLDGTLRGGTTAGRYQLEAGKLPQAGRFAAGDQSVLDTAAQDFKIRNVVFTPGHSLNDDFVSVSTSTGVETLRALPENLRGNLALPIDFFRTGQERADGGYEQAAFGSVTLLANDGIHLHNGTRLELPAGGALTMVARDLNVEGSIVVPGGSVDLRGVATASSSGIAPRLRLSGSARINTAGLWINDVSAAGEHTVLPRIVNGGSVTLAGFSTEIAGGSIVDVSGGAALAPKGVLTRGNGGALRITSGQGAGPSDSFTTLIAGELRGYAPGRGASLEIVAGKVRIGDIAGNDPQELLISPSRFRLGGFSNYSIDGRFGLGVDENVRIEALTESLEPNVSTANAMRSGSDLSAFSSVVLPPASRRPAANVALSSSDANTGSLVLARGSSIVTDPKATVALKARVGMDIYGRIEVPAGEIRLSLDGGEGNGLLPDGTLRLAAGSALISPGTYVEKPNVLGLDLGEVLGGGTVRISTNKNRFVAESGSLIDVSGAEHNVDISHKGAQPGGYRRQSVASNAGSVLVSSTQVVRFEGAMVARAASGQAGGGFALDHFRHRDTLLPPEDPRRIVVTQEVSNDASSTENTQAFVPLGVLATGGFDKVRLRSEDAIELRGNLDVSLARSLRLDAAEIAASSQVNVRLAAPRVEIGGSGDPSNKLAEPSLVPTRTGESELLVEAGGEGREGLIDVFGNVTLNGFNRVTLRSQGDLRLTGKAADGDASDNLSRATRIAGALVTSASRLNLESARLYPTSGSEFSIRQQNMSATGGVSVTPVTHGKVAIARTRGGPQALMSAGGSLTVVADIIEHQGDIRAPLGTISLEAGSLLAVGEQSSTSVSGNGTTVPFGGTVAGREWFYNGMPITGLSPKRVSFQGTQIDVAAGANIDISGGGEVMGTQFVPGPGGSRDTLLKDNTFAILPWLSGDYASYDQHLYTLNDQGLTSDRNVYDSVFLSKGSGLPEGRYVLLPSYYALLPGAYVVRVLNDARYRDLAPGTASRLANGATVVAGYRTVGGTRIAESRWSGFVISPGSEAKRESEYRMSDSRFFADQSSRSGGALGRLPRDAGQLVLGAGTTLSFRGSLLGQPKDGGRIAEVDISAEKIAVTAIGGQAVPDGYLVLDAPALSSFGASLLLGGTRTHDTGATSISITAGDIIVANDSSTILSGPEVMLAASNSVTLNDGARIVSHGASNLSTADLVLRNAGGGADGAFVRVAAGSQGGLRRDNPARFAGTLTIAGTAQLSASGSIILDATTLADLQGGAAATGGFSQIVLSDQGQLALGAGNVRVGFEGSAPGSLVLTKEQLDALGNLKSLRVRSYTSLDLYGNAILGGENFAEVEVDTPSLFGWSDGTPGTSASVQAKRVVLINRGGSAAGSFATPDGTSELNVLAQTIVMGEGDKRIDGFSSVNLKATQELLASASGSLEANADVDIEAGRVTSSGPATQAIRALGPDGRLYAMAIRGNDHSANLSDVSGLGANLSFAARTIAMTGRVDAAGGRITLEALGTSADDKIVLGDKAVLNAGAAIKSFGSQKAYAGAGAIALSSAGGGVEMQAGARMDLAGMAGGGDAGTLRISATSGNGSVVLDGTILAAAANGTQGGVVLDAGKIDTFSALNAKLNLAGFTRSRDIRVRDGDLVIAGEDPFLQRPADRVVAQDLTLAADNGSIFVLGTIDASGQRGSGKVRVYAGQDMVVGAGGKILAHGTSTQSGSTAVYSHGGSVELYARDGSVQFNSGSLVDISAGARGDAGQLVFSALRTHDNHDVSMALNGVVRSNAPEGGRAARVFIEGRRRYEVAEVDANITATFDASGNPVWGEYDAFTTAASGLSHGLKNGSGGAFAGARYRAGIELYSQSDLTQASGWDLTDANWTRDAQAGRVTLRSARTLSIGNHLGLPNDDAVHASSWSIRLAGGADLSAADPMATLDLKDAEYGDVILTSASSRVRSADGSIEIGAGRDFRIGNAAAVVMSTGVIAAADSRFTQGGGDISVHAGRDAIGIASPQSINEWLRRTTLPGGQARLDVIRANPAQWWSHRALFNEGIGSMGGGQILIHAGRDIEQLSASSPTSGRAYLLDNGTAALEVLAGGDVSVNAERNVIGGEYLLGRGLGRIKAGENLGTTAARTALYLMGEHNDALLRGARLELSTRGDIFIQNVSNPTIMTLPGASGSTPGFENVRSAFFTYADESAVELKALLGDVNLASTAPLDTFWSEIAPPRYSAIAMTGDVRTTGYSGSNRIRLFPSSGGGLKALAAHQVYAINVEATDVLPSALPSWRAPEAVIGPFSLQAKRDAVAVIGNLAPRLVEPGADPDIRYAVVANTGDITDSRLYLPRRSEVLAGNDIVNLQLAAQNLRQTDRSRVEAGRDIRYENVTSNGIPLDGAGKLFIGGPGEFFIRAGRNIDLGTSEGIVARGDADNVSLPISRSARLIIAAGLKQDLSAQTSDDFFASLLEAGKRKDKADGLKAVLALVFPQGFFGSEDFSTLLSAGSSDRYVEVLGPVIRTNLMERIRPVDFLKDPVAFEKDLTERLKTLAGILPLLKEYSWDLLTPQAPIGAGNLSMVFSKIKTEGGSGIDMIVPYGNIEAGLTTPVQGLEIGIITTLGGGIRTYLSGNFNINQSKLLTMQGGDILAYSSLGDIDAGRGARDSRSTQPPRRTKDANGLTVLVPPIDASGSGIRTLTSDPDGPGPLAMPQPGDVFLFAPSGTINAGEAGIVSAGNIVVDARLVLNAPNISAAGSSTGVPIAPTTTVAATLASSGSSTSTATKSSEDLTRGLAGEKEEEDTLAEAFRPTFINVEVLGYGEKCIASSGSQPSGSQGGGGDCQDPMILSDRPL